MNERQRPEQIIRKLREVDQLLAGGSFVAEVARQVGCFPAICHQFRGHERNPSFPNLDMTAPEGGAGHETSRWV